MPLPDAGRIRALLHYAPDTGGLTWRVRRGGTAIPGAPAGLRKKRGHYEVKIDWVRYQSHRLIWKYMTGRDPVGDIDHKNPGNKQLVGRSQDAN